jgi:cytidine deaminase
VLEITVAELCERAEAALNPQDLGAFHVADVGCAVVAEDGSVHTGACIGGYLGLCAEQSALSAVVAQGPPRIVMLAPCGAIPGARCTRCHRADGAGSSSASCRRATWRPMSSSGSTTS